MAAAAPDYSYTAGLVKVLENPRWPVARACQAVEACLDMNKCAAQPAAHNKHLSFCVMLKCRCRCQAAVSACCRGMAGVSMLCTSGRQTQ